MQKCSISFDVKVVRTWQCLAIVLLVVILATACRGERPTPTVATDAVTVTFEGDQCVFHGPEQVPAGKIVIVLDVRDQTAYEMYILGVATLDEGKTIKDLEQASFDTGIPLWLHDHGSVNADHGTSQEKKVPLFEGPMYLVCFTSPPDQKTGVLGPIEIIPKE